MSLAEALLLEMGREYPNTRKAIERVPEDKFDWKPHEKSLSMGRLASHVSEIPGWSDMTVNQDKFEIDPENFQPFEAKTSAELLGNFDKCVAAATTALQGVTDEHLGGNWQMIVDGKVAIDMPRIDVFRVWVLNHMIHHRGQLSVYLRLCGIPVPATYGPSADEDWS